MSDVWVCLCTEGLERQLMSAGWVNIWQQASVSYEGVFGSVLGEDILEARHAVLEAYVGGRRKGSRTAGGSVLRKLGRCKDLACSNICVSVLCAVCCVLCAVCK